MLRFFSKCHRNQKGEGEGSLIFLIIIILSLISGVFWFIGFIKDTKHARVERSKKAQADAEKEKKKLALEKHEPKGYIYYYRPGIHGKEPYKIIRPYFDNED